MKHYGSFRFATTLRRDATVTRAIRALFRDPPNEADRTLLGGGSIFDPTPTQTGLFLKPPDFSKPERFRLAKYILSSRKLYSPRTLPKKEDFTPSIPFGAVVLLAMVTLEDFPDFDPVPPLQFSYRCYTHAAHVICGGRMSPARTHILNLHTLTHVAARPRTCFSSCKVLFCVHVRRAYPRPHVIGLQSPLFSFV